LVHMNYLTKKGSEKRYAKRERVKEDTMTIKELIIILENLPEDKTVEIVHKQKLPLGGILLNTSICIKDEDLLS